MRKGSALPRVDGADTKTPDMANDTSILEIDGELDMHRAPLVKEQLKPLLDAKTKRVLIDMTKVSYIDSSGLALFIEALQRTQAYGGAIALFGLGESVNHIFQVARLDQVFKIFPDKAAALAG
jgi:anti-sigma B factor antagonist